MQNYRIFFKYANILNEILLRHAFLFLFVGENTLIVFASTTRLPGRVISVIRCLYTLFNILNCKFRKTTRHGTATKKHR